MIATPKHREAQCSFEHRELHFELKIAKNVPTEIVRRGYQTGSVVALSTRYRLPRAYYEAESEEVRGDRLHCLELGINSSRVIPPVL